MAREPTPPAPALPTNHERWAEAIRSGAKDAHCVCPDFDPAEGESPLVWARRVEVPEQVVLRATAEILGVEFWDRPFMPPAAVGFVEHFPIAHARRHAIVAVESPTVGGVVLLLGDPLSWPQLDVVRRLLPVPVTPMFATRRTILDMIDHLYQQRSGQAESLLDSLDLSEVTDELSALVDREDLLDTDGRAPVIKIVNLMLFDAVRNGASDIHVQPYPDKVVIRMRIDGVLFDALTIPKSLQEEVTSRIKVQGKMNIAEKRLPQDGRATVRVGDRMIDLRIASLPGSNGERVVIRLLDKSARLYTLTEVGMDAETLEQFSRLIRLEHGLILVTGPTGSGKSTTLYAALQEIDTKNRNAVTLEDPIEYEIHGVSQTQINVKKGLTFATGLRNVLRQDPDIIMVGEIRDHETAVMAIQSALTGHLVFSTLHTNDAASAVTRMLDLGIEPYLLSSSLLGVLAQRLVRKVCSGCGTPRPMTDAQRALFDLPGGGGAKETTGEGCEACRDTGYRGRLGIFEQLVVDDAVRDAIQSRQNASAIRAAGVAGGMRLLRTDGVEKILAGKTTIEEVERVTMRTTV